MNMTRSFARPLFFLLGGLVSSLAMISAEPIPDAEQHLQAREYAEAASLLAEVEGDDYADYLRATALFLAKKFPEAEKVAAGFAKAHPESRWIHKARFLHARALIEQRKHEAAEKIFAGEAERVFSTDRKERLAGRLITFADQLSREPGPGDLDALPPDHQKALGLYRQVLDMEITRELRDLILFKAGSLN